MSSSDIFYRKGKEIRSSLLRCDVNLENIEKHHLQLCLRPYDKNTLILKKYYDPNTWDIKHMKTLDCYYMDCFYDEDNDSIEFNLFESFDLFVFNICSLLNIGTLKTYDDNYLVDEDEFAHIFQRVSVFYLTLEEFKLLDGFVGMFTLNGSSISFDGVILKFDCIHESVSDGDHVPDVKSKLLKRGEDLLNWCKD